MGQCKVVILHNIISPYKTWLFNAVHAIYPNLHVLYISETEDIRQWKVDKDAIEFPYTVMFSENPERVKPQSEIFRTLRHLDALNPDILILGGWSYAAYWTGLLWARLRGRKIVLFCNSTYEDHKRTPVKEKLKSIFISMCSAACVYGTRGRRYIELLGMHAERIFTMGQSTLNSFYAQETAKLVSARKQLIGELSVRPRNIIYIGRFSEEKNLICLLDTFKSIEALASDEWGLILVGDGPQRSMLERHIAEKNIKNVITTGFKQREAIPMYLAVSDVMVLPSIREPWGLVVNEAMAAGLPVIVSRKCGCYPDLIDEGSTGLSFDPTSPEQFAGHMRDVVTGKHDLAAMGRMAREKVSTYTVESAAQSVVRAIKRAAAG